MENMNRRIANHGLAATPKGAPQAHDRQRNFVMKYACLRHQRFVNGIYSIRPVDDAHIEPIRVWRNEQITVLRQKDIISAQQQRDYYETKIWPAMTLPEPDNILMAFFERSRLIGYGGLVHIAWEHRRAELSFLLDTTLMEKSSVFRKLHQVFLNLIRLLAFEDLVLNRLYTETYSFRSDMIASLEHFGFQYEGEMRQHVRVNGSYVNSVIHGYLTQ
jgi:RimJ/RimL family protein N-acetyltransferase